MADIPGKPGNAFSGSGGQAPVLPVNKALERTKVENDHAYNKLKLERMTSRDVVGAVLVGLVILCSAIVALVIFWYAPGDKNLDKGLDLFKTAITIVATYVGYTMGKKSGES